MNQDETETYPLEIEANLEKAINYVNQHTLTVTITLVALTTFGLTCIVFNGWNFINAEPLQTHNLSPTPSIIGFITLIIGAITIYGVNANYLNKQKLTNGIIITILGITFLTSSVWITTQRASWNFPKNAPDPGFISPLLANLRLPFFAIGIISLLIGITLIKYTKE